MDKTSSDEEATPPPVEEALPDLNQDVLDKPSAVPANTVTPNKLPDTVTPKKSTTKIPARKDKDKDKKKSKKHARQITRKHIDKVIIKK